MIEFELKKMFIKNNFMIMGALFVVFLTCIFPVIHDMRPYLNNKGDVIPSIHGVREKYKEEKSIAFKLNENTLMKWYDDFQNSSQKGMLVLNPELLNIDAVSFKQEAVNLLINFTEKAENTNATDVFLDKPKETLKNFQTDWEKAALKYVSFYNEYNLKETEKIASLYEENIKEPFYYEGTSFFELFISLYQKTYFLVFIFAILTLSNTYTKRVDNGIDDVSLISKFGKSKLIVSKYVSRLVYVMLVFSIYYGGIFLITMILNGGVNGLKTSIQLYESASMLQITLGETILVLYFLGIAGILLFSQFALLASMVSKNTKVNLTFCGVTLFWLYQYIRVSDVHVVGQTNLFFIRLNPLRYINTMDLFFGSVHYFIFDKPISYINIIIMVFIIFSAVNFAITYLLGRNYYMG